MAKKVISYLLEGDGSVPKFVHDGGHFPIGHELIGISVDEDARHVPDSVHRLTEEQLLERVQSIYNDSEHPRYRDPEEVATEFIAKLSE